MSLHIDIICPAPAGSRQGNRITALRWAGILRSLGHRVRIAQQLDQPHADLVVALHARRSAPAAREFRNRHPDRPLVVALAGTDLYRDLARSEAAAATLAIADRVVVLQSAAIGSLPPAVRRKTRVIYQSATRIARPRLQDRSRTRGGRRDARARHFDVCVLSHLRPVKDPLRAAMAARRLEPASRIRVLHAGRALTETMAQRARRETAHNPRYVWLGERSHARARELLARSRLLVVSSRMEGGANVIGEAAVNGIPVLASRVPGNVGLLGARYPGFFPLGDTEALARLLGRAETDSTWYAKLRRATERLAPLFSPAREQRAWCELLEELGAA